MHWPPTVNSPPRQFSALVLTQVPAPASPAAAITRKPDGQVQAPSFTVPPSQTIGSLGARVIFSGGGEAASDGGAGAGGAGATAGAGGGGSGIATTGEAAAVGCSGSGGGVVCVALETHWPFLNSCQGKQPLSEARFRFGPECAGEETEETRQIKIAALAKTRVMQKPLRQPKRGAEPVSALPSPQKWQKQGPGAHLAGKNTRF